jgi:hypothetical protein
VAWTQTKLSQFNATLSLYLQKDLKSVKKKKKDAYGPIQL